MQFVPVTQSSPAVSPVAATATAAAPTLRLACGVRVKKIRRTDRSRPTTAIRMIASKVVGKRVLSQKAIDMLEDIMNYSCKEVMRSAASICSGSKKTITDKVCIAAFQLVFRHSAIQKKCHDVGMAALQKFNTAEANKKAQKKAGQRVKVPLSGKESVIGHALSVNRVGTIMRRYMLQPCDRLAEGATVYATGFLENFIACVIKSAETFVGKDKDTRMMVRDISSALRDDNELRGIIPAEIAIRFRGQSSGVKRKRADGEENKKKKPAKKRSRKN